METEKRLKKDLKRTKVLLADAQIMLDHLKSNAPSKREIAQLKNQVRTLCCVLVESLMQPLMQDKHCLNFGHCTDLTDRLINPQSCEQAARVLDVDPLMFVSLLPLASCFLPPVSPQLEESEFTCAAAVKARKGMEIEIEDMHIQMEDVVKNKASVRFGIGYSSVVS